MSGMGKQMNDCTLPKWVPDAARNYLQHTEGGISIRAVARQKDCHPSTVMRQVRRFEGRRDDPLVDGALDALSSHVAALDASSLPSRQGRAVGLTQSRIEQEAKRVLRRMAEQGAVLAVAREMETAVVVRQTADGAQIRTAVVSRDIAQALALKDWISCADPEGRIVRYVMTNAGRAELRRLTAQDENRAGGFTGKDLGPEADWDAATLHDVPRHGHRVGAAESPLIGLSRRRDRDGKPFLSRELVAAGEQLREDFELVTLGRETSHDWDALMRGDLSAPPDDVSQGALHALARIRAALAELGPGLGDVALRCCCYLEGLEQAEKTMGWSARSGKIVLRIALDRLRRHYAETLGRFGPLIG